MLLAVVTGAGAGCVDGSLVPDALVLPELSRSENHVLLPEYTSFIAFVAGDCGSAGSGVETPPAGAAAGGVDAAAGAAGAGA